MGKGNGVGLEGSRSLLPESEQPLAHGAQQHQPSQNGVYDNDNQNASTPTLQACVENVSLWLQLNQVTNQGLKEAVAQAQTAYPLLAELFSSVVSEGTSGPSSAAIAGLGRLAAPQPPPAPAPAPQRETADSALARILSEFARTGQVQQQLGPPPPQPVQQQPPSLRSYASTATNFAPGPGPSGFRYPAPMTYTPSMDNTTSYGDYAALGVKRQRPEDNRQCCNCGVTSTPFWRKDRLSGLPLCNACGLYAAKNDHPRPARLWREGQFNESWDGDDGELQQGRGGPRFSGSMGPPGNLTGGSGSGIRPTRPGAPGIVAWPPLQLPAAGSTHHLGGHMESNMVESSSCPPRIGELPPNIVAALAPSASVMPPSATGWRRPNLAAHSPYDLAQLVQQVQQAHQQASLQQNGSAEPPVRNQNDGAEGAGKPPTISAAFVAAAVHQHSLANGHAGGESGHGNGGDVNHLHDGGKLGNGGGSGGLGQASAQQTQTTGVGLLTTDGRPGNVPIIQSARTEQERARSQ